MLNQALTERVAKIISRYSMLARGSRVGVAVSGGADSVALLHILYRLSSQFGLELVVVHMNHHLRGLESEEHELFVRSLAESLGLTFLGGNSVVEGSNLEAQARRLRREFFEASCLKYGLTKIALGHTGSDQAETVLHRLLRGSGLTGLAAMQFSTKNGFIRPLLTTSREEIRHWAAAEGLRWREDSSNTDLRFTRNRLRHETMPTLTRVYNENLEVILCNTALLARAEEDYWLAEIEAVYQYIVKQTRWGLLLSVGELYRLHPAVTRRLIRRALTTVRANGLVGLGFDHIERVLELCSSTKGHDRVLIPGADALRSFDSLLLSATGRLAAEARGYRTSIQLGQICFLPFGAGQICLYRDPGMTLICDNFNEAQASRVERVCINWKTLAKHPLWVRNWEPGDKLHRSGHRSPDKVKHLLQESRVRLWERHHWPVVVCYDEPVWVRGFGAAEKFEVSEEDPDAVYLMYRSESPA